MFRDKKNRRDKKGNAQSGGQNGCTSPSHDPNETDAMPEVKTPTAQTVRRFGIVDNDMLIASFASNWLIAHFFPGWCN